MRILLDIRFWIFISVATHLTAITLPPLDPGISWRETDVLMIARNFYEGNHNIFYPTTDMSGEKSGIVGCEFPLLNYLIYVLSIPFGFHDWFGRLINLLVSTAGVYFFYRSIKEYFSEFVAFCSGMLLLVSYWFLYSRLSLPDTFAASLNLIAIFAGIRYLKTEKYSTLIAFVICGMFGCLAKISAAVLLTVLLVPFLYENRRLRTRLLFVGGSGLILLSTCSWYFMWVPYLSREYGLGDRFFMGMRISEGITYLINNPQPILKKFYHISMQYSGFGIFLIGLVWMIIARQRKALFVFAVPFLAYCIMFLKISYGFAINNYYVVMHLPMMAFVAGYFLGEMKWRGVALFLLAAIAVECIANQIHILNFRESTAYLLELESFMDRYTKRNELVAIVFGEGGNPTPMYMAHRRGWTVSLHDVNMERFRDLQSRGCRYYLQLKPHQSDVLSLPLVAESGNFVLYRLDSTRNFVPPAK